MRTVRKPLRIGGLLAAEVVLLGQLVLFGHAPGNGLAGGLDLGPSDAAAAQILRAGLDDTSMVRTAAADGCTVDAGIGGGVLGSCDDVADFEAFSQGWRAALAGIHAQNGTSHVIVSSDPSGADVLVNEVLVGQTPIDVAVPAGAYLVKIRKDGYAPFTHGGTVTPDAPATITKKLVPTGGKGLAVPISAATLLALVGSDAIPDGDFEVDDVIRDRDGNYYVAFWNSKEEHFPKPVIDQVWPDIGDNYIGTYGSDLHYPTTQGVAKSIDGGRTWTLVAKWVDKQTWTLSASKQFQDADWNKGTPNAAGHVGITQHWVRVAYEDHSGERYEFGSFVPRADGGITIQVWKRTTDVREIQGMYDNLPAGWCRADDPDFGKNPSYCFSSHSEKDVYRYIDRDYLNGLKDPDDKDAFLKARFGMTDDDLATWNDDTSVVLAVDDRGSSAPIAGDYSTHEVRESQRMWMDYIGRYVDPSTKAATDYFLQYQRVDNVNNRPVPGSGRIYASSDGGRSVQLYAEFADSDAKQCQSSEDQCFPSAVVAADGRIYVRSMGRVVYRVDRGSGTQATLTRLGSPYVTTPNRTLPLFRVDSAGNAHELSRTPSNTGRGYDMYYQYFPGTPVAFEAVELITTPNCAPCELAASYLTAAGVPFARTDRPGAYAADAYPVLKARVDGADQVVEHANATSIARTLGVSYPAFIARQLNGFYDLTMDGDEPVVVVRADDGAVTALTFTDGAWTPSRLMGNPDTAGDGYAVYMTGEWPYNQPGPRPDGAGTFPYTFLYENGGHDVGNDRWQSDYQLWTDETAPVSETYDAVQQVSQLIPAATFEIFLGEHGNARAAGGCGLDGSIVGDICSYVQDNTLAETDGARTDLVTVDLRKGNETAVDGNIVGRTIGGSMTIDTVDEDGKPDVRTVGLLLLVDNQRLVVWDPELNGAAHDLSTEGVHFTGADERWTIVNNLALPNSIPCGPDQALYLPAQSVSSYTPKDIAAFELPCLQSLEVPPTPIAGADSWTAVTQRLADETIDALAQSLPLLRSSSRVTNWELAFGSRDATIRRIVSLDHLQVPAGVPAAAAVDGKTTAIVTISGAILGEPDEPFDPKVSVEQAGTADVVTTPMDSPAQLAWERQYLELEAQFLEAQLRLGAQSPDLMQWLTFSWHDKQAAFQDWLVATRALLHCNAEGRSFRSVELLVARELYVAGALRGTSACLADFLVNPGKHWPTLDPTLLPATPPTSLAEIIHTATVQDPTLAFLERWTDRDRDGAVDPQLYGRFLVEDAKVPWTGGWPSIGPGFGLDLTLDDMARLETFTTTEFTGVRGAITKAVLMSDDKEHLAVQTIARCARTFGTANPYPDLVKLTSKQAYTAGIPCVDAEATSKAKIETYQRLSVGLRSGLFGALVDASGSDMDLLTAYLGMANDVLDELDAATEKYGESTTIDAWSPELSPLERFVIVARHETAVLKEKGKRWTIDDIKAVASGVVDCGVGQVKAIVGGLGLVVVGAAATYAGGWIAIGASVVFVGTGAYFAWDADTQLANAFSALDLQAKTAGLCGAVVGTLMALDAFAHAPGQYAKARQARKVITVETVKTTSNRLASTLQETMQSLTSKGGKLKVAEPAPAVVLPADLVPIIDKLPEADRPLARHIADAIGYDQLTTVEKTVVQKLLEKPADERWRARVTAMNQATPFGDVYNAWDKVGTAVIALATEGPKSISASVEPAQAAAPGTVAVQLQLVGRDANLVTATTNGSATDLLGAALASPRLPEAMRKVSEAPAAPAAAITAPEETAWLLAWQKSGAPSATTQPLLHVTSPEFVAKLKTAAYNAQHLSSGSGTIIELKVEFLKTGADRVAYNLTGTTGTNGGFVRFVAKYGPQTAADVAYQQEIGELGLTAQVLADPIENVDGKGAGITLEEYLPGDQVGQLTLDSWTGKRPLSAEAITAMAEYAVRFYEETRKKYGTGKIDLDAHYGNWVLLEGPAGSRKISAYEVDLKWARDVPEDLYYATELARRYLLDNNAFLLPPGARVPYIRALLAAWAKEGGSDAAIAKLQALKANLADPAFRERMYKLQDRTGYDFYNRRTGVITRLTEPDFTSLDDLRDGVQGIIEDINTVLGTAAAGPAAPLLRMAA